MSLGEAEWIAVDWGTSNLRAWGIGACGDVKFSRASDQGMSKLTPDAYPGVLGALLTGNFPTKGPKIDVLICGMAGARRVGWRHPISMRRSILGRWPTGLWFLHCATHASPPAFSPASARGSRARKT